jgi:hypothetical protein
MIRPIISNVAHLSIRVHGTDVLGIITHYYSSTYTSERVCMYFVRALLRRVAVVARCKSAL